MHVAVERNRQKRRVLCFIQHISLQPIGSSLADIEVTLVASDLGKARKFQDVGTHFSRQYRRGPMPFLIAARS